MPRYKGQLVSSDFIISISLFLVFITLLVPLWSHLDNEINDKQIRNQMENKIVSVSSLLINTKGHPSNWDKSNVNSIGLGNGSQLDRDKISELMNMSYNKTKELLGLKGFDFYFNITDYENEIFRIGNEEIEFGKNTINGNYVFNIRRFAIYNDSIAIMNVVLGK